MNNRIMIFVFLVLSLVMAGVLQIKNGNDNALIIGLLFFFGCSFGFCMGRDLEKEKVKPKPRKTTSRRINR